MLFTLLFVDFLCLFNLQKFQLVLSLPFYTLTSALGRGRTYLFLYWVSTLEERLVEREVASSSTCLNTWDKSRALVPTPVERPITTAPYRPRGV